MDSSISRPPRKTSRVSSLDVEMSPLLSYLEVMMEDPREEDLLNSLRKTPSLRLYSYKTRSSWEDQSRLRSQDRGTAINSNRDQAITDSKMESLLRRIRVLLLEIYHSLFQRTSYSSILRDVERSDQSESSRMRRDKAEVLDSLISWMSSVLSRPSLNQERR